MRIGLISAGVVWGVCLGVARAPQAIGAAPSAVDALQYAPMQKGIEYERPSADDAAKCTIKAEKYGGSTAWVVRGPDNALLRQFSDSNSDNVVDTWGYFLGGLEIYRDIDSDFNGKADRYRWFHTAGMRTGIDSNEDGQIDAWEQISPEEVAAEVVAALSTGDAKRFQALLATDADIKKMGQSDEVNKELQGRVAQAVKAFAKLAEEKALDSEAEFTDFGGLRPGLVPAGTRDSTEDLTVYENVWAMMLNKGQHEQLQLGTLIRVGEAWKLADAPTLGTGNQTAGGIFFAPSGAGGASSAAAAAAAAGAPSEAMQKVLAAMEKLDKQMATSDSDELAKLSAQRADLLQEMANISTTRSEQEQWLRQLADTVSAAIQGGQFPRGVERLQKLEAVLAKNKASESLLTHFEFRRMQAENGVRFANPKANHAKLQEEWLEELEKFVKAHQQSEHAAEALLQLGMYSEFSGETEKAGGWYAQLAKDYPDSPNADKAKGALTRLNCVGRPLQLAGEAIQGGKVDLSDYRGKVVLIHYWSTAGSTAQADHAVIKDVYSKYGGKAFEVIGVSLDYDRNALVNYLNENRLPWKQIFEEGGFESRPADEMGVIILPLFVLVGADGKVVSNSLQAAELEAELKQALSGGATARVSERRR